MNRNNIWIHLSIAVVLIAFAAVVGQIERWKVALVDPPMNASKASPSKPTSCTLRNKEKGEPEVLVRFRPGVTLEQIRSIAAGNHDSVVDEIEAVDGLAEIDDLDNASPEAVADQYSKMSDLVVYAEPNFAIQLDEPAQFPSSMDLVHRAPVTNAPNDPEFAQQWALNNLGQDGGKKDADISALLPGPKLMAAATLS